MMKEQKPTSSPPGPIFSAIRSGHGIFPSSGGPEMKAVDGPRQLTLGTENDSNEQLLVSVQDTGIGLPPNQAGQIFNAFFTTKEHGTGMGLRISRTIIEAHGGRLWATDNHPRGASFHFTLAVSSDAASWDARSNC
jgi:signal transduction histidine kinase